MPSPDDPGGPPDDPPILPIRPHVRIDRAGLADERRRIRITHEQLALRRDELATERLELENRRLAHRNQRLALANRRFTWDIRLSVGLAAGIFGTVLSWLAAALWVVHGQSDGPADRRLSDPTLITLLTTTTLIVVGLLTIVARYLFPRPAGPTRPGR